jgi:chromosomal replication initiator protein
MKKTKAEQIWQTALGELQMQVTRATFETWVKDTRLLSYEDGAFILGVHSTFAKDWLENRLHSLIKRTLSRIMGRSVDLSFVVWSPVEGPADPGPLWKQSAQRDAPHETLLPHYTFDRFVVGPANQLAYAASRAVADNPATAYNPLFLYGGVGLGKTHLLHAIGNHTYQRGLKVRYVSSEHFTNDLINAIRTHTTVEFRERYRSLDMLLIDDIQFIAGKESTQEEFFHTFNTLHDSGWQIVITSDRSPRSIPTLENRLRSRFEGGLIADIQPPPLETRIAILRFKAESKPVPVPNEVIDLIAQQMQSNVRELEGALNRVVAHAVLMQLPLTLELAQAALDDYAPRKGDFAPQYVIDQVSRFYSVGAEDITGRSRNKKVVRPRQVCMYLVREETRASLPQIGRMLGNRDHSTVLHGHGKIANLIEEDPQLRRDIMVIRERLYGNGKRPLEQ